MKDILEGIIIGISIFLLFAIAQMMFMPFITWGFLAVYYGACSLLLCAVYYAYRR